MWDREIAAGALSAWIFHRPILVPALLLLANCFIVWFLYLVLRRDKAEKKAAPERELIETR